jgi:hypothetical protein
LAEPAIVAALEARFWQVTRLSITDWPDLHCGKVGHAFCPSFLCEVKTGKRQPTKGQVEKIKWLRAIGWKVVVCNDVNVLLKLLGE